MHNDDISRALDYSLNVEHTDKSRVRSIDVAKRVLEMGTDRNTLIATLLSEQCRKQSDQSTHQGKFKHVDLI